jgi:uncharacterized SAM-binding protein YcdF (DUF218 family)
MEHTNAGRSPSRHAPSGPQQIGIRMARWLAGAATIGLLVYLLSAPILSSVGRQLVDVDPLERADAMLVLASGLDRVIEAADLYQQGYSRLVLLTEVPRDASEQFLLDRGISVELSEARRKRILEALGVPADAIVILPGIVSSTADEGRVFARWAKGRRIRSLLVVTSPYHTARTRLTFRHMLQEQAIAVRMHGSTLAPFPPDSWWRSRDNLRAGIIELQKLLYYRLFELSA